VVNFWSAEIEIGEEDPCFLLCFGWNRSGADLNRSWCGKCHTTSSWFYFCPQGQLSSKQ